MKDPANIKKEYDVVIIGGGIVGANILYQLSKYDLKLLLVEANPTFATETSRGNSGVIHGGFDPEPHKIEARMNVLGNQLWTQEIFHDVIFPRRKIDSLVVAYNEEEMTHVHDLYQRGLQNRVKSSDLKILDRTTLLTAHPNLNPAVIGALVCTSSWIIDPVKATLALVGAAVNNDAQVATSHQVTKIIPEPNGFQIVINNNQMVGAKNIVNAAGHYADHIAAMAGYPDFKQTTRRGEYRILDKSEFKKVDGIYFKLPNIYGKGVIVVPTLDGRVMVGPTAENDIPKEDVGIVTPEKYELIGQIGHDLVPSLNLERTVMTMAGSRPIDLATNDFVIGYAKKNQHFINAAGMQSPGLSSAPAVAYHIVDLISKNGTKMVLKPDFKPQFTIH